MADNTRIDWATATINPLGWGCYGPGGTAERPARCPWCYAYRIAKRNLRDCPHCCAFVPHWHSDELHKLRRWRRPRLVFVQSMGDMFGSGVSDRQRGVIWDAMRKSRHTHVILTKNPGLMHGWCRAYAPKPLSNVWLGVSVTNQVDADERIPPLIQTPAAVRLVSWEPALGELDITAWPRLDWLIVGAQTGPGAVPPKPEWIEQVREQCQEAHVAYFEKRSLSDVVGRPLVQEYPQ